MSSNIDGGEQPQGQDPSVEVPQVTQPEGQGTPPERGPSPWAKDLDELGLGENSSKVDQYLAEKWQPRMTQLEQQYAPFKDLYESPEDAKSAAELLHSLRNDPQGTLKLLDDMVAEMYPESGTLTEEGGTTEEAPEQGQPPALDPEYKQLLDQIKEEKEAKANQEAFDNALAEAQKEFPSIEGETFAKLILANNGSIEGALADYKNWFPDKAKQPDPPPPITGDGPTTPPLEDKEFDGDDLYDLVLSATKQANAKK